MIQLTHKLLTQFHRELATPEWLQSCAKAVESRIRANAAFQTADGRGSVSRDFDEESWMWEQRSTVRYLFEIQVKVSRCQPSGEFDTYMAAIEFDPLQNVFRFLMEECFLLEDRQSLDAMDAAIDKMLDGQIPIRGEFPCLICDGTVRLFLKERGDEFPPPMSIFGGVHCSRCTYGRELCFIAAEPHIVEFVRTHRSDELGHSSSSGNLS